MQTKGLKQSLIDIGYKALGELLIAVGKEVCIYSERKVLHDEDKNNK